jgi:signal transduction histidine kinase
MNCDPLAISVAFHALVDNAIKYSDKGHLIRIYGQSVPGGHAVIVENITSVFSIGEDEVEEIVKKYRRGRMPSQQKMEGSGIGLLLATRIMELHKGELRVLSRVSPIQFALLLRN